MAVITEVSTFSPTVKKILNGESVDGHANGVDGPVVEVTQQLTNRTRYLKNEIEELAGKSFATYLDDRDPPTSLITPIVILTQPHLRTFVWTGSAYVRAEWHQPAQLGFFAHNSTIPGWLPARGDVAYNIVDYPDLAPKLGFTGTGTFRLPEMRGEIPKGLDLGRGVDANRVINTSQPSTRILSRVGIDQHLGYVVGIGDAALQSNELAASSGWAEAGSGSTPSTLGYSPVYKVQVQNTALAPYFSI